jgi:hypothetical protein
MCDMAVDDNNLVRVDKKVKLNPTVMLCHLCNFCNTSSLGRVAEAELKAFSHDFNSAVKVCPDANLV